MSMKDCFDNFIKPEVNFNELSSEEIFNMQGNNYDNIFKNENEYFKVEEVIIKSNIESISDLIEIIDKYPLLSNVKYNINIEKIHSIRKELIELNSMIGLEKLKKTITYQLLYYLQYEDLKIKTNDFLHTVIYGPPGTGKTEIAKIIGNMFSKIGILKSGVFKKVTRGDLVAEYLGQTAIKTRKIVNECIGGVLFIDEAYSLGNTNKSEDIYSKECIDTLCEMLSDLKNEIMVIIAGYKKELNDCFFSVNQGLESRFNWRFTIDEYTSDQLAKILESKIIEINWTHNVVNLIDWFTKKKDEFPYYGRDIENLLAKMKISHSKRVFCLSKDEKTILTTTDLDNGFKLYKKNKKETDKLPFLTNLYV